MLSENDLPSTKNVQPQEAAEIPPQAPRLTLSADMLPSRRHHIVTDNLESANQLNPDREAAVKRLSKQTGYAPEFISANLEDFRKRQALPGNKELDDLRDTAPETYSLLNDKEVASLIHDEYKQLGFFNRSFKMTLNAFKKVLKQDKLAGLRIAQRRNDLKNKTYGTGYDDEIALLEQEIETLSAPKNLGLLSRAPYHAAEFAAQMLLSQPDAVGGALAGAVAGAGGGAAVGSVVPGIGTGAGALTGGTWGGRAGYIAGLAKYANDMEGGLAYGDLRNLRDANGNPVPVEIADKASRTVGYINAALETAGDLIFIGGVLKPAGKLAGKVGSKFIGKSVSGALGKALAKIPGADGLVQIIERNPAAFEGLTLRQTMAKAAKQWAINTASETATEYVQNVVQLSAEEAAKAASGQPFERRTAGGVLSESLEGMDEVAVGAGTLGLLGFGGNFHRYMRATQEADRVGALYMQLGQGLKDIKLTQRAPDKAIAFLASQTNGTPLENLYIPIKAIERVAEENQVDPHDFLQAIGPEAAAQYEEAKATGGDIEIKTATWAVQSQLYSKLTGKPMYEAFARDVKASPQARTQNELSTEENEVANVAAQAEQMLKEGAVQQEDIDSEYQAIMQEWALTVAPEGQKAEDFQQQLEHNAQILARFNVVEAKKRGISTAEFAEHSRLPIIQTRLSAGQQQAFDGAKQMYGKIKDSLVKNEEVLAAQENGGLTPIIDYLIKRGGVSTENTPWVGETENWHRKESNIFGLVNNKHGIELSGAAKAVQEMLQQNGWGSLIDLSDPGATTADVPDLIEAVNNEIVKYVPLTKRERYNKRLNEILNVSTGQFKTLYEKEFNEKLPDRGTRALKNLHYFLLREAVKDGLMPSESVLAEHNINAEALSAGNFDFGQEVGRGLLQDIYYPINQDVLKKLDEPLEVVQIQSKFADKELQDISFEDVTGGMLAYLLNKWGNTYATNNETGIVAMVSKSGKEKIFSSQRKAPKSIGGKVGKEIAVHLGELFKHAVLVKTLPDKDGKTEYKMHRFFVPAQLGSRVFAVKISVKEYANKRNEFSFQAYDENGGRDFGIYDLSVPKEITPVIERRDTKRIPSFHTGGQSSSGIRGNNYGKAEKVSRTTPDDTVSITSEQASVKPTLRDLLRGVADGSGAYNKDAPGNELFQSADPETVKSFAGEVSAVLEDAFVPNKQQIEMGFVPYIYQQLGLPKQELKTNKLALRKALGLLTQEELQAHPDWHNHNVPRKVIDNLPYLMADPVAVFKSNTAPGRYVAVLDAVSEEYKPIIAIISPNTNAQGYTFIPTIYERENFDKFVSASAKAGNVLYIDKKRKSSSGALTLAAIIDNNLHMNSILTKEDIVNRKLFQSGYHGTPAYVIFDDKDIRALNTFYRNGALRVRGMFNNLTNTITLTPDANASTLTHELAHYMLNERWNYLNSGLADESYKKDFAPLAEYLGIENGQKEISRDQHEKFAKSFEAYLREGKAPSLELGRLFGRFRRWLLKIYRDVKKELGVELNDNIRRVFDRMLATEEEIVAAERQRTFEPFTKTPGMTDEDVKRLARLREDAHNAAVVQIMKEEADLWREENSRKEDYIYTKESEAVEKELSSRRDYQLANIVESHFSDSRYAKDNNKTNSDLASARELAHAFHNNLLNKEDRTLWTVLAENNGMTAAEMAEMLVSLKPFKEAVMDETSKRMGKYELNKNMKDLRRAQAEALANDRALDVLALERDLFLNYKRAASVQRALETKALVKKYAREWLRSKPARLAARYSPYFAAQKRAAVRAARALARQDYEAAAEAKMEELFNAALAAESIRISKQLRRLQEHLKYFQRKPVKQLKKQEHYLQIADLLQRLGYGRNDYSPSMKLESLAEWAKRYKERGYDGVMIPDWLTNESRELDWRKMSIDSLQQAVDAIKNIAHTANFENRLFSMHRRQTISELAFMVAQHLHKTIPNSARKKFKDQVEPEKDGLMSGIEKYFYSMTKIDTLLHKADGFHDFGFMWDLFGAPTKAAADKESVHLRAFKENYKKLIDEHYTPEEIQDIFSTKQYHPELGDECTKERLLAMALNMGNEQNRQRLFKNPPIGHRYLANPDGTSNEWTEQTVQQLLRKNLTAKDWDFVQGVWDLINEPWGAVSEMHRKLTGFTPGKVEALPFAIATADGKTAQLRGGYYPIKYDWRGSRWAEREEYLAQPLYTESNQAWAASTKQGHTKARAKEVTQPLALNLNLVERHMTEVIHDLYFRPVVVDLRRLLDHDYMRATLIKNLGRNGYQLLKAHLNMIATGGQETSGIGVINKTVEWLRKHTTIAVLAGKTSVIVENLANPMLFVNAVEGFTAKDALKGIALAMSEYGPQSLLGMKKAKQLQKFVFSKSSMMKDKSENFDVTMRQLRKSNIFGEDSMLLEFTNAAMVATDDFFAIPMWLTAYNKWLDLAIKEGRKEQEAERAAIEYADMLINRVLGTGRRYDAAEIMRNRNAIIRCLTMFATFMNNEFNRWSRETGLFLEQKDAVRYAGFVAGRLLVWHTMSQLLAGKWPDDWGAEELLKWWFSGLVDNVSGMFVGVRDILPVLLAKVMGWQTFGYRPTPISGTIEDMILRPAEAIGGYVRGKKDGQATAEAVTKAASYIAPYPGQLNTWFFNAFDYVFNDSAPRARDLYRRRPKKERGN